MKSSKLKPGETTFILPAQAPGATARVRIFTPSLEMPFAGHPTLGTAHVVRDALGAGDRIRLAGWDQADSNAAADGSVTVSSTAVSAGRCLLAAALA